MTIDLISLLMVHFLCNAQASVSQVSVSDAHYCSAQFEKLKIGFHPGITLDEFKRLEASDRASVSVEAYGYYRKWIAENRDIALKLRSASTLVLSHDAGDGCGS